MKDINFLTQTANTLLKESPMSLCGLFLKSEYLKVSKDKDEKQKKSQDILKIITSSTPYDSYDEYAIAEAYLSLNKKEESFNYLKLSSSHENMLAKHKIGTIYFNGDLSLNIIQSKTEAIKWFRASCEFNCPLSQYSLGYCCYLGDGVPRDRTEAVTYYNLSAKQGYTIAEHKLANCLENGIGIDENWEESKSYYERAASKGYEPSIQALALLIEKINEKREEQYEKENNIKGDTPRKISTSSIETV